MRPQSMSAVITPLERAGIVERRPDPDDARAAQVSITAEGARIIGESRAAKQAWLDRMMSERLSTAERRTLREATALLERMLQP
jgi:DNA-binding MarR family transcriptional regulator